MSDLLIIGAGFAGLTAAWQAARQGHSVQVIAKGWGAAQWLSGCVDVLGYHPIDSSEPVSSPAESIGNLVAEHPQHPYALIGLEMVADALAAFQELVAEEGYLISGNIERNWLLPSGVGVPRPTCLAPATMTAGDLSRDDSMLIVGFKGYADFHPGMIADNLVQFGVEASHTTLDLPTLNQRHITTPAILALLMEQESFQEELAGALNRHLGSVARVGFPAVLGQKPDLQVKDALEKRLQRPVFEIPTLTPSIAGMRLQKILIDAIRKHGGRVTVGIEALEAISSDGRITAVYSHSPTRKVPHSAEQFLLATGGILGGGISTNYLGEAREAVFDLPVTAPASHVDWFHLDFLDRRGHPIYRSGIAVNEQLQPLAGNAGPLYENLRCAGTTLAHAEVIRERSFEGVAIATGFAAARQLG
jgi:glycerol-3-phosphate dehydrogenase subunit B